ncbi:MAG TPA: biotin--[acetyl-CoA-carboxylase] ligase [Pyrinomonadaceae bacterium]|nr:biotin--[acetyl-CoA-carboxylase] ligase [Pyrinomonadaceae bacterium]
MNIAVLTYESIDSTNTEALKQARLGAEEGLCIVARQQTAGRGRHGRTWVSERDSGLYFSIVLRPKIETQFLPLITLMTGVAVHDTLAELGIDADIKWVNDLHVNGKKICGILAETTDTPKGLAVVVGIGINIKSSNYPPEIASTATSIEEVQNAAHDHALNSKLDPEPISYPTAPELARSLTKFISYFYDILRSNSGPADIIDEWRKRSTYFSGKRVRVVLENGSLTGITDGLEPNGALRIRTFEGDLAMVQAGDVEQLREESDPRQPMHAN